MKIASTKCKSYCKNVLKLFLLFYLCQQMRKGKVLLTTLAHSCGSQSVNKWDMIHQTKTKPKSITICFMRIPCKDSNHLITHSQAKSCYQALSQAITLSCKVILVIWAVPWNQNPVLLVSFPESLRHAFFYVPLWIHYSQLLFRIYQSTQPGGQHFLTVLNSNGSWAAQFPCFFFHVAKCVHH